MTDGGATPLGEGLTLTGKFVGGSVEQGKVKRDSEDRWPDRYKVSLLVGLDTARVEYRDREAFLHAVGHEPVEGEVLSLAVGVRAAQSYVFYFGRNGSV